MSELSKKQKTRLVQLARRAFNLHGARARGRDGQFHGLAGASADLQSALDALAANGSAACFATWRHEQVALACGKHGLRLCSQLDYKAVEARFLELLGATGKAFNAQVRAETEPRRQAEAVLAREMRRFGFRPGYVEAICQNQFKCAVMDASAAQLWKLVYTVRNRGNSRRKEAA